MSRGHLCLSLNTSHRFFDWIPLHEYILKGLAFPNKQSPLYFYELEVEITHIHVIKADTHNKFIKIKKTLLPWGMYKFLSLNQSLGGVSVLKI